MNLFTSLKGESIDDYCNTLLSDRKCSIILLFIQICRNAARPTDCLIIPTASLLQDAFNFIPLQAHIFRGDVTAAHRAHIVRVEPLHDALRVERVPHVASKGCHLVTFFEIHHAHDAIIDAPKSPLIICDSWNVLKHTSQGLFALPGIAPLRDQTGNDAGAEDDDDDADAHRDESLGQDKAHDDSKYTKTVAWIRIVAMRSETLESPQHIDGPHCVEYAHHGFQNENASSHPIFLVGQECHLVYDPENGLCQNDTVKEDQVELC